MVTTVRIMVLISRRAFVEHKHMLNKCSPPPSLPPSLPHPGGALPTPPAAPRTPPRDGGRFSLFKNTEKGLLGPFVFANVLAASATTHNVRKESRFGYTTFSKCVLSVCKKRILI